MKHFKKLVLVCLLMLPCVAYGQQVPLFNQYFAQPTLAYPSASVFQEKTQLSLLYRGQWSGLDGAPQLFSLSFANSVKQKFGYNININSFEAGLLRQTYLSGGLAKAFQFNDHKLSIGVELGVSLFSLDESRVSVESLDDELIRNLLGSNGASGSLGLSFSYQYKALQINAAVPSMVSESLSDDEYVQLADNNKPDYLVGAGYRIPLDRTGKMTITPNITWRYQELIGSAVDVLTLFELQRKFQVMAAYRDGYGANIGMGIRVRPNILFTYNYDFGQKETPFVSNGFNEVGLHFSFNKKSKVNEVEALKQNAEQVIDRLQAEEIYDKNLISPEDQEVVIDYYTSLQSGNKKERRAKGEAAFDALLEEIEQKGLARMKADAQARVDAATRPEQEIQQKEEPVEPKTPKVEDSQRTVEPTKQQPNKLRSRYILVVAAYLIESSYSQGYLEQLKTDYPDAGTYRNEQRGYDYIYILKFDDFDEAISKMRALRNDGSFSDGWIHVLPLRNN